MVEISWGTLWRIAIFLLFAAIAYGSRQIILALFFAIVISAGLESIVNFFERYGVPRLLGTILVFLIIIFSLVLIIYIAVPIFIIQLNDLFLNLNKFANLFGSSLNPRAITMVNSLISEVSAKLFQGTFSIFTSASQIFSGLSLLLFVFFSSFYLTLSRAGMERFIISIFPASSEAAAMRIYKRVNRKLGAWLRIQFVLSVIIGTLVFAGLTLLGVKYAVLLGILAAIFEIVPFVGPIISGGLSVLTALSISPILAIYTLIMFFAVQELEGHILVPILMNRVISLHPVVVLFAILVGFETAGLLGIIISVPVAALLEEIIEEWSSHKTPVSELAVQN
ncbi:MAG: AI-2E family transporter [Patescibacteria group bacterium]|nr:AI-2E family transporter [Patescibacteria group bacterium]